VQGAGRAAPDPDRARQREVVDAFFLAAHEGDFDALAALLDPDVVLRIDAGARHKAGSMVLRGAGAVTTQVRAGLRSVLARPGLQLRRALVNGAVGVVATVRGRPVTVIGFTVTDGKIVEMDAIADPARVRKLTAGLPAAGQPTGAGWAQPMH
jgi:RNA polymerase sigma-70 factor (ECF subfamily)